MTLTVKELINIIEKYAPINLKESFDNVGFMVGNTENEVTSILVSLDCTMEVIEEAIEKKCNFILTHHPLIFKGLRSVTNETIKGRKILKLIKENISVYSSHTNLDSTKGGLNDFAMELLGFKEYIIIEKNSLDAQCGIGRVVKLKEETTIGDICDKIKKAYNLDTLKYSGSLNNKVKNIALINGSGSDFFTKAKNFGVQCIITGDTKYHDVFELEEEGVFVIDAGHFGTEWPAMNIIAKILEKNLKKLGYENKIIISEKARDTYKVI